MKKIFKAVWIFLPLAAAAAMYFILPHFPEVTEYVFSRGLFKAVTVPLGFLTSLVPISLTELAAVLALPLLILLVVIIIIKLKRSRERKKTLVKAARGTCAFLSFTCLMYMVCHGANFYRLPMEKLMGLDTSQKNAEQLLFVCKTLAEGARGAEEGLPADENGATMLPEDIFEELTRAGNGYEKLTDDYPFLWTSVFRQKPVMLSEYWSYTFITGMYFPFFAECNVNTAQPDYAIPFTAAHESAHSRGIALENECSFLAFVSCINSDYAEYRYSGYLEAFVYCANALYGYDKDMWREAYSGVSERMLADLAANGAFVDAHRGKVQKAAAAVNDAFIKSQGVSDGELSYNRVTELILAYYCTDG